MGTDDLGRAHEWWKGERRLRSRRGPPEPLEPLPVKMPERRSVAVLRVTLEDAAGQVLQRNFTSFVVGGSPSPREEA